MSVSAVEITRNPWLKNELLKEIQKAITSEFLWPRRIVVPSGMPPASPRPILSKAALDNLSHSDPLLAAERRIDENEIYRKNKLKREQADEKELELDLFIGEGARQMPNATEAVGAGKGDARMTKMKKEMGDGKDNKQKRRGWSWSPPWSKQRKEEASAKI